MQRRTACDEKCLDGGESKHKDERDFRASLAKSACLIGEREITTNHCLIHYYSITLIKV